MRNILLFAIFATFLMAAQTSMAKVRLCSDTELQVDFITMNSFHTTGVEKARIHGKIDTPNPGYIYSLVFKPLDHEGVLYGILKIHQKGSDTEEIMVVTPMEIAQSFDMPMSTSKIFIKLIKPYNWGANYFQGDFKKGYSSRCLTSGINSEE